ncbi:hypothetical protein D3C87_1832850 [compost metagenome]
MYSAQREPKVACTNEPARATICSGNSADDNSRANSYRLRASASRLTDTCACSRSPAVSCPINRPTASSTAKVSRYCTSDTAKDASGCTKKKSNSPTQTTDANAAGPRP